MLQSQIIKMCNKWDEFTNSHKSSWLEQKELFIIEKHPKKDGRFFLVDGRLNWIKGNNFKLVSLPKASGAEGLWVQGILGSVARFTKKVNLQSLDFLRTI